MDSRDQLIDTLREENESLRKKLLEADNILEAIRDGEVDALVINDTEGIPQIFAMESADYTYRILIEKFNEGALSISDSGLILYCNDYFARLTGMPAAKVTGTYFHDYFPGAPDFSVLLEDLQSGDGHIKMGMTLEAPDQRKDVDISFTDLRPAAPAIGIVVTDLSEKKAHEQALIEYQQQLQANISGLQLANKNLEEVIHVISHDLKEPLRKIITYISYFKMKHGHTVPDGGTDSLEIINASALRLNSLLEDIVKYALTGISDRQTNIDLNVVLKEVTEDLELQVLENNASVILEMLPFIEASEVQMRQLFSNLVLNAIKYRKAGTDPVITIDAVTSKDGQAPEGNIRIRVRDNGIGIDAVHLPRIFTIFKRLHGRDAYAGNGIGLAICKKIMDQHGGTISVDSIPGAGSTFNLDFPLK